MISSTVKDSLTLIVALLIVALLSCGAVTAASAEHPAQAVMQRFSDEALTTLRNNNQRLQENPEQIYGLMRKTVSEYVDFPRVARLVMGSHWRTASAQQRQDFTQEFSQYIVRFYAKAMEEFIINQGVPEEISITYLPFRAREDDRTVTVMTRLSAPNQRDIPVNYSLYQTDGSWKVYDVTVEGVSVVRNYRTTFNDEIRARGLDTVIESLRERNRSAA